jgi:hypothetical protein
MSNVSGNRSHRTLVYKDDELRYAMQHLRWLPDWRVTDPDNNDPKDPCYVISPERKDEIRAELLKLGRDLAQARQSR